MKWKNLLDKGKKIVDERGGVDSLKQDAEELKKIATGKGSMSDKAKQAAAALKDPGARGGEGEDRPQPAADKPQGPAPAQAPPPAPEQAQKQGKAKP